jgi:hypothetical protein
MSSYSRRPRAIRIVLYEDPMLGSDEVRADAIASGISHGTELALYRGDSAFGGKRFDLDLRQFVEDDETRPYPMRLGTSGWVGWAQSAPTYAGLRLAITST